MSTRDRGHSRTFDQAPRRLSQGLPTLGRDKASTRSGLSPAPRRSSSQGLHGILTLPNPERMAAFDHEPLPREAAHLSVAISSEARRDREA
jgi:hypothetical protein